MLTRPVAQCPPLTLPSRVGTLHGIFSCKYFGMFSITKAPLTSSPRLKPGIPKTMLGTDFRLVPASTATADAALWPNRSNIASTGSHGEPLRENITGRVHVAVMPDSARRAIPEAHVERQRLCHRTARRTRLAD